MIDIDKNEIVPLKENEVGEPVKQDGSKPAEGTVILRLGERVVIKNYRFKIIELKQNSLTLKPLGPTPQFFNRKLNKKEKGRLQKKAKKRK